MKHYFLGSNTPTGFVGYYNEANKSGNRLFILKGGSGVGKHTFMKKIAADMEAKGFDIDYCHCSNDVNSLDGIIIPAIGVGLIDGTSPHMVDPRLPACFDEIVNLGKYINANALAGCRDKIAALSERKKQQYSRAYTYLSCAKQLHDDTAKLISSCVDKIKFNEILTSLPKSLISKNNGNKGSINNIFASAYTSGGYVDYIGTLVGTKHTVGIKNYYSLNNDIMLAIYNYALAGGTAMTVCHSILDPSQIDHILMDNLNIISIDEHNKFNEADEIINLKDIINKDKLLDTEQDIMWNNVHFDELVEKAVGIMSSCGAIHNSLESIYIPAMDFDGVNKELEIVLKKIHSYIL